MVRIGVAELGCGRVCLSGGFEGNSVPGAITKLRRCFLDVR